jgi:hypothetical protein
MIRMFGLLFQQIANGGDLHLPIATFYDVPVISLRSVILPSIMRDPMSYVPWFAVLDRKTQRPDMRHVRLCLLSFLSMTLFPLSLDALGSSRLLIGRGIISV